MGDDMRLDTLRARQNAVGCTWLFLAVPGVFGIILLIATGGSSGLGWVLTILYVIGTGYLGYVFVRARQLSVAKGGTRRSWAGLSAE